MKKIFIAAGVFISSLSFSQIGVNTSSPNSTLDVSAKRNSDGTLNGNDQLLGMQAPRITRAELTANTAAYGNNQVGALIYITDVSSGDTSGVRSNIDTVGYYYFDGALWKKIGSGGSASAGTPFYITSTTTDAGTNKTDNIVRDGGIALGASGIDTSAKLQINSTTQGILPPRMSTAQINAITNPAIGLIAFDEDRKCLVQNVGTSAVPNWSCMSNNVSRWFYMPSMTIDTSVAATGLTKDLYAAYQAQFNTPAIKSAGAPNSVPFFASATDLYYYITSYDTSVFANVSINANGVMTYDVIAPATECSVVNIVFMLK